MTTFQAIIYAITSGVTEFLPISAAAHRILVPFILGWQAPSGALLGALSLGSLLALLIYFRHDWASMISSVLQVIIFRKLPMTLDERLPMFLGMTALPVMLISPYFTETVSQWDWTPLRVAIVLVFAGIPLWFFDNFSRKIKAMYDWKWLDAGVVGLVQASAILPGWDPLSGALLGASFLNYKRESALKYSYFSLLPILLARTFSQLKEINFHATSPMADLSWLSFLVAIVVTTLVSLLWIGGFMKHVLHKGVGQYVVYRIILALGICGLYWARMRNGSL